MRFSRSFQQSSSISPAHAGHAPHAPWDIAPVIGMAKSRQSYAFAPVMSALHASPQKSQTPFAFSSAILLLPFLPMRSALHPVLFASDVPAPQNPERIGSLAVHE